jgi:hypothetical protein
MISDREHPFGPEGLHKGQDERSLSEGMREHPIFNLLFLGI